jgi:hypothetical protein
MLSGLTSAERLSSDNLWPEYTTNTIMVHVSVAKAVTDLTDHQISGPDQVDLHMTDLPGEYCKLVRSFTDSRSWPWVLGASGIEWVPLSNHTRPKAHARQTSSTAISRRRRTSSSTAWRLVEVCPGPSALSTTSADVIRFTRTR